ncbi:MarR family transcriptional regulator [Aestuariibacter sp. GS-14]|uniref:MarR family winged helix-turn-helix transcriptional regulator n=1 Tax=Aestuariibacter sp. GS-14 TaxID=2590670 RepID=UPI00112C7ADB|nr:MarR family transcriptional regulator [Aestuariibacter sp. GS-14]TPV59982.1 MarR family transcriptional regulator [Aestuariibacter sp. GS-14]
MYKDVVENLLADWRKERPDLDGDGIAVVARIINLANRYEQEINRFLKDYGINYTDFDLLATLRRKGSPFKLSPGQLQDDVILTSGAMTACLKRLEKKNLLARTTSESDRRGVDVQLTEQGKSLVDETISKRFEFATLSVKSLESNEQVQLANLLQKLSKS